LERKLQHDGGGRYTMIKSDKDFLLKSTQQLNVRLMKVIDWMLDCEKRMHTAETDSWYLNLKGWF
jgi:hypothetical protein